eukprot:COSAG02_NODE_19568_length_875_cov_2.731959_1_plen_206_part_00
MSRSVACVPFSVPQPSPPSAAYRCRSPAFRCRSAPHAPRWSPRNAGDGATHSSPVPSLSSLPLAHRRSPLTDGPENASPASRGQRRSEQAAQLVTAWRAPGRGTAWGLLAEVAALPRLGAGSAEGAGGALTHLQPRCDPTQTRGATLTTPTQPLSAWLAIISSPDAVAGTAATGRRGSNLHGRPWPDGVFKGGVRYNASPVAVNG